MAARRIDEHTLGILEFGQIREILSGFASSDLGRGAGAELFPSVNAEWIADRLAETSQMKDVISVRRK